MFAREALPTSPGYPTMRRYGDGASGSLVSSFPNPLRRRESAFRSTAI